MFSSSMSGASADSKLYVDDVFSSATYAGTQLQRHVETGVCLTPFEGYEDKSTNTVHSYPYDIVTSPNGNTCVLEFEVASGVAAPGSTARVSIFSGGTRIASNVYKETASGYQFNASCVAADASNNFYIGGYWNGKSCVIKIDSSGNLVFSKTLSLTYSSAEVASVKIIGSYLFVCGKQAVQGTSNDNGYVIKFDLSGNYQSNYSYRTSGTQYNHITADIILGSDGYYYTIAYGYDASYAGMVMLSKLNSDMSLVSYKQVAAGDLYGVDARHRLFELASGDLVFLSGGGSIITSNKAMTTITKRNVSNNVTFRSCAVKDGFMYLAGADNSYTYRVVICKINLSTFAISSALYADSYSQSPAYGVMLHRVALAGDKLAWCSYPAQTSLTNRGAITLTSDVPSYLPGGTEFTNVGGAFTTTTISGITTGALTSNAWFSGANISSNDITAYTRLPDAGLAYRKLTSSGGMVWVKSRAYNKHAISDTTRAARKYLSSNLGNAATDPGFYDGLPSFHANGFNLFPGGSGDIYNSSGASYVAWTFKKAPKFFDIVTWVGNGANRLIPHNLGAVPGMIITKSTTATSDWMVYHRSQGITKASYLYSTNGFFTDPGSIWNGISPTDTHFSIGASGSLNTTGQTYVAYIFGHDTTSDGIIQCGTVTLPPTGELEVTLGWEPQYVMAKCIVNGYNWDITDNSRGMNLSTSDGKIYANLPDAEGVDFSMVDPRATGFKLFGSNNTYVYMAIRRPNKPVTDATKVFKPITRLGTGSIAPVTGAGFAPDLVLGGDRTNQGGSACAWWYKLKGPKSYFRATSDVPATTGTLADQTVTSFDADGVTLGADPYGWINYYSPYNYYMLFFKRAVNFLDVVSYVGTGVAGAIDHNLNAVPELIIVKSDAGISADWAVYYGDNTKSLKLNLDVATSASSSVYWNNTSPTKSIISLGTDLTVNGIGTRYVAFMFATLAGVSKVGSYVGSGTTKQIDCGFSNGARFILIKRTDSTGDWFFWDSARGITTGADAWLKLNAYTFGVTDDYIDPYAPGFEISSTAPAAINASGGTFIYLAIA